MGVRMSCKESDQAFYLLFFLLVEREQQLGQERQLVFISRHHHRVRFWRGLLQLSKQLWQALALLYPCSRQKWQKSA